MTSANPTIDLSELQSLIDAYGADITRWPQQHRHMVEALLVSHAEVRAMWSEARNLDQLLDRAGVCDGKSHADLVACIVARALSERPAKVAPRILSDNVVPLRPKVPPSQIPPAARVQRGGRWQTGGLLAASLMMGLLIGGFGLTSGMLDLDDEDTVAAILGDGLFTGLEEDRI